MKLKKSTKEHINFGENSIIFEFKEVVEGKENYEIVTKSNRSKQFTLSFSIPFNYLVEEKHVEKQQNGVIKITFPERIRNE